MTGDTISGATNASDFLFLLLKGCVQAHAYPQLTRCEGDMIPVDYCARALVALSRLPMTGQVYHLAGDNVPIERYWHLLRRKGVALEEMSFESFRAVVRKDPSNVFAPLVDFVVDDQEVAIINCEQASSL